MATDFTTVIRFKEALKILDEIQVEYSLDALEATITINNKKHSFAGIEEFVGFCNGLRFAKDIK